MILFRYLDTRILFQVDPAVGASFAPIVDFFRQAMTEVDTATPDSGAPEPDFIIHVRAYDRALAARLRERQGRPIVVRRSSAAAFNIDAYRVDTDERCIYVNEHCIIDAPQRCRLAGDSFVVHLTPPARVQVIDFIRDLVIRRQECAGSVILHASGIRHGGRAILFAGPKGAGKSTALLACLERDSGFFTGDKSFCQLNDTGIRAHPWWDFPHIGAGTLRARPDLLARIRADIPADLDTWDPGRKLLIEPELFERWTGTRFRLESAPLAGIVMPRLVPGQPLEVREIDKPDARWAHFYQLIERSADTTFFTWQHYLVPDWCAVHERAAAMREALADVRFIAVRGDLGGMPGAVARFFV